MPAVSDSEMRLVMRRVNGGGIPLAQLVESLDADVALELMWTIAERQSWAICGHPRAHILAKIADPSGLRPCRRVGCEYTVRDVIHDHPPTPRGCLECGSETPHRWSRPALHRYDAVCSSSCSGSGCTAYCGDPCAAHTEHTCWNHRKTS